MSNMSTTKRPVAPRKSDLARCRPMADSGLIPIDALYSAAALLRSAGQVQEACGPGHHVLDLLAAVVPAAYLDNWMADRMSRTR